MGAFAARERALICGALAQFSSVEQAILYGARAKGTHRPASDIDLALTGIDNERDAQLVAETLDELPLPYKSDVSALGLIRHAPLREHIDRVGFPFYERAERSELVD